MNKSFVYNFPVPATWKQFIDATYTDHVRRSCRSVVITSNDTVASISLLQWVLFSKINVGWVRTRLDKRLIFTYKRGNPRVLSLVEYGRGRKTISDATASLSAITGSFNYMAFDVEKRYAAERKLETARAVGVESQDDVDTVNIDFAPPAATPRITVADYSLAGVVGVDQDWCRIAAGWTTVVNQIDAEFSKTIAEVASKVLGSDFWALHDGFKDSKCKSTDALRAIIFPSLVGTPIYDVPGYIVADVKKAAGTTDNQDLNAVCWRKVLAEILSESELSALRSVDMQDGVQKSLLPALTIRQGKMLRRFFKLCDAEQISILLANGLLKFPSVYAKSMFRLLKFLGPEQSQSPLGPGIFAAYKKLGLKFSGFRNWDALLNHCNRIGQICISQPFLGLHAKDAKKRFNIRWRCVEDAVLAMTDVDFDALTLSQERRAVIAACRLGL